MIQLILDTSHTHTIIALSKDGILLDSHTYLHESNLSALFTLSIQSFLKKHDLSIHSLSSICVGIGPGSYTGTRVAVAVAKTLSLGLEIPLIPFCSILAYIPSDLTGDVLFFIPTKQSTPFIAHIVANETTFLAIKTLSSFDFSLLKTSFLVCSDKESLISSFPNLSTSPFLSPIISLQKLSFYLHQQYLSGNIYPLERLDQIELIYLANIPLPKKK